MANRCTKNIIKKNTKLNYMKILRQSDSNDTNNVFIQKYKGQ